MPLFLFTLLTLQRGFSLIYTDFKILQQQNQNEALQNQTFGFSIIPQSISSMLCEFELKSLFKRFVSNTS